MCGIAARFGPSPFDPTPAFAALAHRGPDGSGSWSTTPVPGGTVTLAHTRLSILDPQPTGAQPMLAIRGESDWMRVPISAPQPGPEAADRTVALILNGEIYNFVELRGELTAKGHRFISTGDTEVLLRGFLEWGTEVFRRVDGVFSCVVYDGPGGRLVAARDPLGVKPLYTGRGSDGAIFFASEVRCLKALLGTPPDINREAITRFLRFGSVQEPSTLFQGIAALEPGHLAEVNLRDGSPGVAVLSPFRELEPGGSSTRPGDLHLEHDRILRESVSRQLRSDVPVGLFLSGGVDSTVLACLAAQERSSNLSTFTLAGKVTTHDEVAVAAATARHLGVEHRVVRLSEEQIEAWVGDGLSALDQPSCDGVNTYLLSRASRATGLVVVLSGAGADELHGTYGYGRSLGRLARWSGHSPWVRALLAKGGGSLLSWRNQGDLAERWDGLLAQTPHPWRLVQERRRFFGRSELESLWPESSLFPDHWTNPVSNDDALARLSAEAQIAVGDVRGYLLNTLLRDGDAVTMANQQELRVPFLGVEYAEFMLSAGAVAASTRGGPPKPLLCRLIPEALRPALAGPKRGFSLDYASLIDGPFRERFDHACAVLRERLGFTVTGEGLRTDLARLTPALRGKRANRLWALLSLGVYLERHG